MSSTIHALRAIVSTKTGSFVRGMKAAIMATRQRVHSGCLLQETRFGWGKDVAVIGAIGLISASTFGSLADDDAGWCCYKDSGTRDSHYWRKQHARPEKPQSFLRLNPQRLWRT